MGTPRTLSCLVQIRQEDFPRHIFQSHQCPEAPGSGEFGAASASASASIDFFFTASASASASMIKDRFRVLPLPLPLPLPPLWLWAFEILTFFKRDTRTHPKPMMIWGPLGAWNLIQLSMSNNCNNCDFTKILHYLLSYQFL